MGEEDIPEVPGLTSPTPIDPSSLARRVDWMRALATAELVPAVIVCAWGGSPAPNLTVGGFSLFGDSPRGWAPRLLLLLPPW